MLSWKNTVFTRYCFYQIFLLTSAKPWGKSNKNRKIHKTYHFFGKTLLASIKLIVSFPVVSNQNKINLETAFTQNIFIDIFKNEMQITNKNVEYCHFNYSKLFKWLAGLAGPENFFKSVLTYLSWHQHQLQFLKDKFALEICSTE